MSRIWRKCFVDVTYLTKSSV